jgi:hypothetical protein
MSRVAFRVFPAGRAGEKRAAVCAISCAVHEEGESLPNNRRSRPSLNADPAFCVTLYIAGGVGELYQRRSTLCEIFYTLQTTTPSGLGTSENGW